uniref:Uncharacterized protein n=1 Tax=Daphnia galeata TaxID=27404 RepID=A0A8J2S6V7_9CRUS|nr:unnamed protein product [Daphnia galeata]
MSFSKKIECVVKKTAFLPSPVHFPHLEFNGDWLSVFSVGQSVHLLVDDTSDSLPLLKNCPPPSTGKKAINFHQKSKNIHSQQQQQPQPQSGPPSYPNQQIRPNATYHFDDASQKYAYGGSYVGGTSAGQVSPPLPLVSGFRVPIRLLLHLKRMSQGPPSDNFVGHSPLDLSKQTPPHHQSAHHSLPPASLGVNQQLAMANPGHTGPMQGRSTQGNNQFFGRPIRPGNQHMPRPPMAGGTINPNHPPNAQAIPYPGLNQPVLFVIGDQFNQQSPYLSAYPANPPAYYPQSGNLPPGNVSFQQPRAAQQSNGYRQTPPYPSFPMQSSPAVYYQPQQPQPQQPQQQPQQQKEQQPQQQPEQPQQVPVAPPPTTQPRESSGASRRARSSALRLVDPNTNRDVLTGEEVPPSAVVTPTTFPEIVTTGAVSAPVVMAADEVEAPLTATSPFFSETEDIVSTPSNNTNVALIEKVKAKEKTVPTVVASPTPSVPAAVTAPVGATPIIAVPVTQQNGQVPSSRDPPNNITMTAFLPINFPANMKSIQPYLEMATDYASVDPCISRLYALEQGFLLKRKEDNLPFLLDLMQVLGKNKNELQSKIETTDVRIARTHLEDVSQKLLNWAESAPVLVSLTDQQSSRENSVTRPIRETAQPPTLSREVSKDVLIGKSTVTDDEIEQKSHALLGEYFTNKKIEDAVLDMKEWLHPSTVARFINQCLLHVLEHNKKERRATGTLLKEMVKRKLFHSSDILDGFTELLQSAEDFIVDIPKLWEYVAELVVPLFEEDVINLNFLPQLSSILNSSMVANFVAAVLKELVKEQGVAGAERILIMSNVPLTSVLPSGVDPNAFFAQHKELDFLSKIDSIPRSSGSVGKSNSSATPASQVNIDFQHSLEKYLRDATHLTTDDVCSWIQEQYVGDVNPAFIRALVTAVTESSIEGRGTESKLNNTVLKHWTEVLRRYVDNIPDRELQLLYAVQTLVTKRQHPKGLIQGIFETLYDSNVVSEEGFETWALVDDPLEREGKAVALKMIKSFLTCTDLQEANLHSGFCSATSVTATKKSSRRRSRKKVQRQNVNGSSENQDFQNENSLKPLPVVLESAVEKPSEKPVIAPPITATDDGENEAASLRYTYKDDQWSPVNPQGKRTYGRNFLLELQNSPACQKKPPGLPILEVAYTMKRGISVGDSTPPIVKMIPANELPQRNSRRSDDALPNLTVQSSYPELPSGFYKGASGGMTQSTIGAVEGVASQEIRSKRYQKLEDHSQNSGFTDRSLSQQLFSENSVTRPIRETAQPPTLSGATPDSQVNIGFQYSLEKYLRDATHLTTDEVCNWIQEKYVGEVNPAFIRALVTAVIESSIEGRGTDSKLNNTVLIKWTEFLRCYVGNIPDRELQLLYAVQTLVTQRQHPKGLIQGIFETLYDTNVVSLEGFDSWALVDDPLEHEGKDVALEMVNSFITCLLENGLAFESWMSADDPLEREGKAEALSMITSFLRWLKEDSDQDLDASKKQNHTEEHIVRGGTANVDKRGLHIGKAKYPEYVKSTYKYASIFHYLQA